MTKLWMDFENLNLKVGIVRKVKAEFGEEYNFLCVARTS